MTEVKVSHRGTRLPRSKYLVFGEPQVLQEDIDEVVATLESGWIGTGPRTTAFANAFREYVGARHAVALGSCTAALQIALRCLGLHPGDEVIVPSMTFAATANAVVHAGAIPVLADVERESMCLDPDDFERKITSRTRAVIPVHFAGRPFAVDRVMELAEAHGLTVIEDCAHAIETLWFGRHAGMFGQFGAYSFYVTKNVVTAEGGMLVTESEADANRAKRLALHGLSADAWMRFSDDGFKHYEVEEPGFKFNMTDLQAALGLHQLGRVEGNLVRREAIWSRYDEAFADLPIDLPVPVDANARHARHLYTILVDRERVGVSREEVQRRLHELGIGTGIHYRALHLHSWYRRTLAIAPKDLPNATWISSRTLSLPLGPGLMDEDVDDVIDALRSVVTG
jgi:dTDP-4-amino-4,6-dideoxygalactose transaminase